MIHNYSVDHISQLSTKEIRQLRDSLCKELEASLKGTEYMVISAESDFSSHSNKINVYKRTDKGMGRPHKVCEIFIMKNTNWNIYHYPVSLCTNDLASFLDNFFASNVIDHIREDHTKNNWAQKIRYFMSFDTLNSIVMQLGGEAFVDESVGVSLPIDTNSVKGSNSIIENQAKADVTELMNEQIKVLDSILEEFDGVNYYRMSGSRKNGIRLTLNGKGIAEIWSDKWRPENCSAGRVVAKDIPENEKTRMFIVPEDNISYTVGDTMDRYSYYSTWNYKYQRWLIGFSELKQVLESIISHFSNGIIPAKGERQYSSGRMNIVETFEDNYDAVAETRKSNMIVGEKEVYPRNPERSENALKRANYRCEAGCKHELFFRRGTNIPYTEAHHLVPLSQADAFGVDLDVEANIVSLCSSCHNQIHYGNDANHILEQLYEQRSNELFAAGIDVSLTELLEIYGFNI